ncbi:substrate-binding domain-containing protein [Pseudonocardia xinjiangensis]|uniref:LacI family transcriptional regulator n=1 Tax=Pseudonocardia xinjiangensis TaxID=75289 RepID=A0ABX1RDV6_9PSEU|nr:LacI family transcriptional regulator [Pseudonocardia xinjiangensis]
MTGLTSTPGLVLPAAASRSAAYAAVRDLLRRPDAPTALLSATDRAAVDGIWAARDLGVAVPRDLAVIGIGNIPRA